MSEVPQPVRFVDQYEGQTPSSPDSPSTSSTSNSPTATVATTASATSATSATPSSAVKDASQQSSARVRAVPPLPRMRRQDEEERVADEDGDFCSKNPHLVRLLRDERRGSELWRPRPHVWELPAAWVVYGLAESGVRARDECKERLVAAAHVQRLCRNLKM
jgi:hypothetical protein